MMSYCCRDHRLESVISRRVLSLIVDQTTERLKFKVSTSHTQSQTPAFHYNTPTRWCGEYSSSCVRLIYLPNLLLRVVISSGVFLLRCSARNGYLKISHTRDTVRIPQNKPFGVQLALSLRLARFPTARPEFAAALLCGLQ